MIQRPRFGLLQRLLAPLVLGVLDATDAPPCRKRDGHDHEFAPLTRCCTVCGVDRSEVEDEATTSTPRPEGPEHAPRMRTSPSVLILCALLSAGCAREGCGRVPPDPEPAECKPGDECPVDGKAPDAKPIEQPPTPAPAQPPKPEPMPPT